MCGIFAAFERFAAVDLEDVARAVQTMGHRGPDAKAAIHVATGPGRALTSSALGHVRLAILDLDRRSDQPFAGSGATTVFNGEIFNFNDVRRFIESKTEFRTTSDTEVLHELVRLTGLSQIGQLIGQWAFVQVDETSGLVTIGRDRYGKKPIFFYKDENKFVVASTCRAIATYLKSRPSLNPSYVRSFIAYGSAPLPDEKTHFEAISQLSPGQHATFDPVTWAFQSSILLDECSLPAIASPGSPNAPVLEEAVASAASLRLLSDRPVGLLLSGGVDSTLIASILHRLGRLGELTCFIGDTGYSDDARYAEAVAGQLDAKVQKISVNYEGFAFESFRKICWHQERPFELVGNLMAMPQLYEAVAQTPIKVVIDGTGADEVFGGYWDRQFPFALRQAAREHKWPWILKSVVENRNELRRYLSATRTALLGQAVYNDPAHDILAHQSASDIPCPDELLNGKFGFDEALRWDALRGRLQDWLWQNDRNSMAYSLEARSPFMDVRLMPWMASGYEAKFVGRYNKFELRSLFDKFAALDTQWRVQKQGFRWSATRFLSGNKTQALELIDASKILPALYPGLPAVMDAMRSGRIPDHSRIAQRLLSVAGVEDAMSN